VGHAAIVGIASALITVVVMLVILFTKIKVPFLMALGVVCGYFFLG